MESAWAGVAGGLVFFGGVALLMWIDARGKAQQRQLAHAERLRALELGRPLPDAEVARAWAEASRAWAAAVPALLVPLGLAGVAVGATVLVLGQADHAARLPLLCVVWGACGLVGLLAVILGLGAVRGRRGPSPEGEPPAPALPGQAGSSSTAIREGDDLSRL